MVFFFTNLFELKNFQKSKAVNARNLNIKVQKKEISQKYISNFGHRNLRSGCEKYKIEMENKIFYAIKT